MCVEVIVCYIIVVFFETRCTSRAYAMMPVCLSVTEVHWCIIANLGFKFRSHFTAHCGCLAAAAAMLLAGAVLLAGESSRAMLASARLSCYLASLYNLCVASSQILILLFLTFRLSIN